MAHLTERLAQNIPGPFYVDATCTDCGLCPSLAPATFRRHDELGYSFVHHQPVDSDELTAAEDAMRSCPTESIGNDGESTKTRLSSQ